MNPYIHFDDIPKAERKKLIKEVVNEDIATRLWNGLAFGVSAMLAICVGKSFFPDEADRLGQLILMLVLCAGLAALFYEAVVKPRIIRLVEKKRNG